MRRRHALSRRTLLGSGGAALAAWSCRRGASDPPGGALGPADRIVLGGRIETLVAGEPPAAALAIKGDRIVAVGDEASIASLRTATTDIVDLQGGTAVPGLVDAHAHLSGLGRSLEDIDLRGARSIDEVVARLREGDRGQAWIQGRGWDQNLWPGAAMPDRAPLDAAFADRPVWLRRVDGHAGWASSAALRSSGIGPDTAAPTGGEILRDDAGAPTGVLVDAAMALVHPPAATEADVKRWLLAAQAHVLARGLTGVHDMGIGPTEDAIYRALVDPGTSDRLALRVVAYAGEDWFAQIHTGRRPDPIDARTVYALRGVKVYADGALGSRGAALLLPYADRPDHRGLLQHSPDELSAICRDAAAGSWQVATHAIGDHGNRATLDAYASALSNAGSDPRWRIEHCQIVAPEDIPRFAAHGIVASMQPTHATSDMPWVPARIGEARLAGAYAWRRFLDAGVHLAFGSDFPVELPDVTHGLHAAITREDPSGDPPGGWLPDQRLDLTTALHAFSAGSAHAVHRDAHLGRLAVGYVADITCFGDPIFDRPAAALREAKILATIIGGAMAYRA